MTDTSEIIRCILCAKQMRYDGYADHLKSQHVVESLRSMVNTVDFNDRPNKRHGQTEDLQHLGPQSRDARINTTSFIWWNLLNTRTNITTTLTCCLRCKCMPFHHMDTTTKMKNDFYRWILSHQRKGCFDSIDEYRKATKTTIQDITAGRISTKIAADVRKTDVRLGLKKKPKAKAAAKTETPASVSETTTPVSETASGNTLSKEAHDILLEINGPFGEGDTIPPTDELVETARDLLREREATIKRLRDTSELSRVNATLHMQLASLRKEQEELKERFREDLAELDAFRREKKWATEPM